MFQVVAPYFLMAMAGTYLGIATAALGEAVNHLGAWQHRHSGASLAEVGVLQHRTGVLSGVSPNVARTFIALDVDLGGLSMFRDLHSALREALARPLL